MRLSKFRVRLARSFRSTFGIPYLDAFRIARFIVSYSGLNAGDAMSLAGYGSRLPYDSPLRAYFGIRVRSCCGCDFAESWEEVVSVNGVHLS